MRGALAILLGVTALFPSAAGGHQPTQPPQSAIRNPQSAISRLVTIAVIVTDARGRAVDDLKPSDFELRGENAALPLESARFVRAGRAPADALIQTVADERQAALQDDTRLSAINALAVHLGSLSDRRKTLVVASEGVGRADRRRGQEFLPTLDTVIRSANRSNVAVYPFDPRDDGADQTPAESLRRLADETDGQAIAADADSGLRSAAADSGAYYLLSFRANHPDDAKYRELQTRVKRAGVRVRAPKGYWAAPPDEALRAALLARSNEPKRTAPPEPPLHVSTLIRPWFGMSRGDGGETRVTFVWEPAVRVPGDRVRRIVSRLVLTARSSDGTVLLEGPVAPTGPAAMNDPVMTPSRAVFDMPPGRLRLRMSIQDAAEEVLDQDVRDISIRDLRGEVAIGTPEVLRARNAREFRTLDMEAAVPVASREFSRTERLLIRFQAYGAGGAPPDV